MQNRVFNFNPGPSALPVAVLNQIQEELLNYKSTGMSILETSHRSPEYEDINDSAIALCKEFMGIGDEFHVLFVGGGASTQFDYIPLNFLPVGGTAAYVDTGTWASKAVKEAEKIGNVHLAGSSKDLGYTYILSTSELDIPEDSAYLHITSNNTIKGTQWHSFPDTENIPLVCDMSSDICTRNLDFSRFSLIYAGAQKNLGPSGVTVVILRKDFLEKCNPDLPTMFDYRTHVNKKSLFNTPPVFAVYTLNLVLKWIKNLGGLVELEKITKAKKDIIYNLIDTYPDFFRGTVREDSRSWMNVTLRLPSEELEQKLVSKGKESGFVGLKGHRSVGGIRVSLYNGVTLKAVEKVAEFMEDFKKEN
jgi:phosphoserine aminotransferase